MTGSILPDEMAGLHLAEALERIGITFEVFLPILVKFAEKNGQKDKEMLQLLEKGDMEGLVILGHTLKGASSTIGAWQVQETARAVELAAKEGRSADEIRDLVDKVAQALEVVVISIASLQ